jgi:hypothetical protein
MNDEQFDSILDLNDEPLHDEKARLLNKFLCNIFDREIRYNYFSNKKTKFIQNGVEHFVENCINLLCSKLEQKFYDITANIRDKIVEDIYTTSERFLKVGSFYEGTKNYFPNEFDFTVVLFSTRHASICQFFNPSDLNIFFAELEMISKTLAYTHTIYPWEVRFKEFVEYRRPAAKMGLVFGNISDVNSFKDIFVDITLAIRVINLDTNVFNSYLYFGAKIFRAEVRETDSYLIMSTGKISFTETELNFMKFKLSKRHLKVYQILKFLINGHGWDEILLQEILKYDVNMRCGISSYALKNIMIYHHYHCGRDDDDLAQCTFDALKHIYGYFQKELAVESPYSLQNTVSLITVAYHDHLLVHYIKYFIDMVAKELADLIHAFHGIENEENTDDFQPWAKSVTNLLRTIKKLRLKIEYLPGQSDIFWESIRRSVRCKE